MGIPRLSPEAKRGLPFECNACGKDIRVKDNRSWRFVFEMRICTRFSVLTLSRKHLFEDLRPYTCFYTDCHFTTEPFKNRDVWISHLELEHKHGPNWAKFQCPLCLHNTPSGRTAILVHFARHLEEIGLASVPRDVESDAESDAGSDIGSDASNVSLQSLSILGTGKVNIEGSAAVEEDRKLDVSPYPDVLPCPVQGCEATFTGRFRRGNQLRHVRLKHNAVEFPCGVHGCTMVFRRQDARLKHHRKNHLDVLPLLRRLPGKGKQVMMNSQEQVTPEESKQAIKESQEWAADQDECS